MFEQLSESACAAESGPNTGIIIGDEAAQAADARATPVIALEG
jgi:hypothetical protein